MISSLHVYIYISCEPHALDWKFGVAVIACLAVSVFNHVSFPVTLIRTSVFNLVDCTYNSTAWHILMEYLFFPS